MRLYGLMEEIHLMNLYHSYLSQKKCGYQMWDLFTAILTNCVCLLLFQGEVVQAESDQAEEEVVKANTLVREANFLAQEMGKQTEFFVTLQIPTTNLGPNRKVCYSYTFMFSIYQPLKMIFIVDVEHFLSGSLKLDQYKLEYVQNLHIL